LVILSVRPSESPSATVWNGNLYVFHQGLADDGQGDLSANGELWFTSFDGTNWEPDTQLPNVGMSGSPSAVTWTSFGVPNWPPALWVFHQGGYQNGELYYSIYDP
jgi:hypothetical protein